MYRSDGRFRSPSGPFGPLGPMRVITIGRVGVGLTLDAANENRAPAAGRASRRQAARLRDGLLWLVLGAALVAAATPAH